MRVLHAFKDYYPPSRGGVEQHINQVVHHLDGYEFTVLTSSRSRQVLVEDDGDVEVIRAAEYFRPFSTPITPSWPRYLADSRFDLVHFHMPNPFGELAFLSSGRKAPTIVTYHAEIVGRRLILPLFSPFQQAFLKKADRIVVSSPRLLETSQPLARHRDRAEIIPFGVDPHSWQVRPGEADVIRGRYRPPLILFVGRLSYYKGLDVLIEAMRTVGATCLIAGEGPKRAELERQSRDLGLADKIVFCGDISDRQRAAYYHAADVFVLPSTSRAECFGIAMLEAMACGTAAISTELGTGTSWVNQNGVSGLVVEPGRPEALAAALDRLIGEPARICEMGEAAAARVREKFTLTKMLQDLDSLYRSV